jgi:cystathionine beta-lyase/cystathionine gamma-synthase
MAIGRQEQAIANTITQNEVNEVLQTRAEELEQFKATLAALNLSGRAYAMMAMTFAEVFKDGGQDVFGSMQCYFGARACQSLAEQKGVRVPSIALGLD